MTSATRCGCCGYFEIVNGCWCYDTFHKPSPCNLCRHHRDGHCDYRDRIVQAYAQAVATMDQPPPALIQVLEQQNPPETNDMEEQVLDAALQYVKARNRAASDFLQWRIALLAELDAQWKAERQASRNLHMSTPGGRLYLSGLDSLQAGMDEVGAIQMLSTLGAVRRATLCKLTDDKSPKKDDDGNDKSASVAWKQATKREHFMRIVHADSDGIFLNLPNLDRESAQRIGNEMAREITKAMKSYQHKTDPTPLVSANGHPIAPMDE